MTDTENRSSGRHHRRTPEEKRKDIILEIVSKGLVIIAIALWIPYMAIEFVPFIKSIASYHKVNLATMCYSALRFMLVFVPIIMITPEKIYLKHINLKKINLLSKWFACISFFFFTGVIVDIISYNIFGDYEDIGGDPIAIKMLWGNIGFNGLVYCSLQSICYLVLWKRINGHKKDVVVTFAMTYALYMILPFVTGLFMHADFTIGPWSVWLGKNIWFFLSNAFLLSGLIVAAQSRRAWSNLIWR